MKMQRLSGRVGIAVLSVLLVACGQKASAVDLSADVLSPSSSPAAALRDGNEVVYEISGGAHARSQVRRTVRADGSETLRGATSIGGAPGSPPQALAIEEVEIDAAGRLVSADIALSSGAQGAGIEKRVHLDPSKGIVRIADARGVKSWRASVDAPWIYAPLVADPLPGRPMATPVAAWATLRAVAEAPRARVIHCDRLWTSLVPRDQLVVEDGATRFAVLGEDAIEADEGFVVAMRLNSLDSPAAPSSARLLGIFDVARRAEADALVDLTELSSRAPAGYARPR